MAVGRGVRTKADLEIIKVFADRLGAQMASTRPLMRMDGLMQDNR